MTNRLELNWKLDGFVDEQRYYCSETLFTAETKPTAKAVLANDVRTYIDTVVEANKTYYVAVGSVKSGGEKLSEVKQIRAFSDHLDNYVVSLLRFETDFTDEKGNIWTSRNANTYVDDGELCVDSDNGGLLCTDTNFLNFDNGAFCFEALIQLDASSLSLDVLRNNFLTWQMNGAILNVENLRMRYVFFGPPVVLATQTATVGEYHHFAWARDESGMMRLFLDGVLLRADSYPTSVNFSYWGATLFQMGVSKCKGVRITKGHARYTAAFTPPAKF